MKTWKSCSFCRTKYSGYSKSRNNVCAVCRVAKSNQIYNQDRRQYFKTYYDTKIKPNPIIMAQRREVARIFSKKRHEMSALSQVHPNKK